MPEAPGSPVALGLRAEDILLALTALQGTSARNVIPGRLSRIRPLDVAVELTVETPTAFRVLVTPAAVRELQLEEGREVFLLIKASAFHRLI